MHLLIHIFLNGLIALLFGLSYLEIFLVVFGGILIDIDHLIYWLFYKKIKSLKQGIEFHKKEYALHRPHFYAFHTFEFVILFLFFSYFINSYLFFISLGFLIHFITDAIYYLYDYKSLKPWAKCISVIYFYKNNR